MMESSFHQESKNYDDASVIFLGDSDEEADKTENEMEGLCLTQLEFQVLTQRREQFMKSETKTLEQYQQLIEQEVSILRTILSRHETLADASVDENPFVINMKEIIAGLCLDLLVNDPVQVTFWNQYEDFCLDLHHEGVEQRNEVFETLLAQDTPASVYAQMCFCEHNLTGNYTNARDYISRGIEKHKNCLELYTTRLTLEIGECYSRRQDYLPEKKLSEEETDILFGNHMLETCAAIRSNFDLKESHVIEAIDNLVNSSCKEFPCFPVHQLKQNFCRDLKQLSSERAVTEVVSLDADILLDAVNKNNARHSLVPVFQTYWRSFQAYDRNPKILHRAIASFRSLDLSSVTVRQFLYLTLDIGLFYQCLDPEHIAFYFKQLSLENSSAANVKARFVFHCIRRDVRLDSSVLLWKVKFTVLLRLSRNRTEKVNRVQKLMPLALDKLGKTRELLTVFAGWFSQLIPKLDDDEVAVMKEMLKWLNEQFTDNTTLREEIRRMFVAWLLAHGHLVPAKTMYIKSRASETRQNSNVHSDLLGQLFLFNPIKMELEFR